MSAFAKKLILSVSLMVLLVAAISQMALGIVPGTAILRSIELTFVFWVIACVAGCLFS